MYQVFISGDVRTFLDTNPVPVFHIRFTTSFKPHQGTITKSHGIKKGERKKGKQPIAKGKLPSYLPSVLPPYKPIQNAAAAPPYHCNTQEDSGSKEYYVSAWFFSACWCFLSVVFGSLPSNSLIASMY